MEEINKIKEEERKKREAEEAIKRKREEEERLSREFADKAAKKQKKKAAQKLKKLAAQVRKPKVRGGGVHSLKYIHRISDLILMNDKAIFNKRIEPILKIQPIY